MIKRSPAQILVQDLKARYGRSRNTIYTWLRALNIQTERIGRRAYIPSACLPQLDDLHAYLENGGSIQEFLLCRPVQAAPKEKP